MKTSIIEVGGLLSVLSAAGSRSNSPVYPELSGRKSTAYPEVPRWSMTTP